jgi:hypothetical protein
MIGKLSLPEGSSGSNFTLTVINTTCEPIVGIEVTSVQPQVSGVADAPFVSYDGALVGASNPLPASELGSGSIPVTGVVPGQEYVLMVTVNLGGGKASQTVTMEIYPES